VIERTTIGSTNKPAVAEKLLPKFIFGPFCEFLNFSFIFFSLVFFISKKNKNKNKMINVYEENKCPDLRAEFNDLRDKFY
jgi:hypothetical protein